MVLASGLDRLLGDPKRCYHPVMAMGAAIALLRIWAEAWAGENTWRLRLAGFAITALLVGGSLAAGWGIERLAIWQPATSPLLIIGMASTLAGRSLAVATGDVLAALGQQPENLPLARKQLSWLVGRDTAGLDSSEILRATAETASENAVDGLFAPLFWLLLGAVLWCAGFMGAPGPLALAWGFKASSTLDSMLGYRTGKLRWLGTAGARLDDLLVWLPCRLVALSLGQLRAALRDGKPDPSPNAGVSQAAYAHRLGIKMGGANHYEGVEIIKPLLNKNGREVQAADIVEILRLNRIIALQWLIIVITFIIITILVSAFIGGE